MCLRALSYDSTNQNTRNTCSRDNFRHLLLYMESEIENNLHHPVCFHPSVHISAHNKILLCIIIGIKIQAIAVTMTHKRRTERKCPSNKDVNHFQLELSTFTSHVMCNIIMHEHIIHIEHVACRFQHCNIFKQMK